MTRRSTKYSRWRGSGTAVLLLALLGSLAAGAQPKPRALRLLQRTPLPPARSIATDIRWAGDDSVYVSWTVDGVSEVSLGGAKGRTLVPDLKTLGLLKRYDHIAVAPGTLAVSAFAHHIAWRDLQAKAGGKVLFKSQKIAVIQDFDLFGDKILLMGLTAIDEATVQKAEAAWVGTLSGQLEDLKPVLHEAEGPKSPGSYNCETQKIGTVRFLADGSYVVAPGFQDGVHLFNASGRRVRTWSHQQIGIDTHVGCPAMTEKEELRFRLDLGFWQGWLNRHHLIDDILPLPQGPGLLVRSWGEDGKAHWALKVLRPGGVTSYAVPVVGRRPLDRLRGDVRNGRIVLLLSSFGYPDREVPADQLPAEILVMELPNGKEGSYAL